MTHDSEDRSDWDWVKAAENSGFLAEKCRWSPSTFRFIHATHLSMIADSLDADDHEDNCEGDTKKTMLAQVTRELELTLSLKRNFGGRKVFMVFSASNS